MRGLDVDRDVYLLTPERRTGRSGPQLAEPSLLTFLTLHQLLANSTRSLPPTLVQRDVSSSGVVYQVACSPEV